MAFADLYARAVAMVGAAAILARRWGKDAPPQALGGAPAIPEAKPQGIPTLKMPTARGWPDGQTPVAAPGLKVNAFATGLSIRAGCWCCPTATSWSPRR